MSTTITFRNWCEQFRSNFQEIEVNPSEEGATALMYACQQEDVDHLEAILKRNPEAIKERDRTLKTVLHYCVENRTLNCAQVVLDAASDLLDAVDEDGYSALHLAVIAGNVLLVNFFISKSADLNKLDVEGHSVIHWATVCGEMQVLQILLKRGANASTPDVHGGYPIHYAAQMCSTASEIGNNFRLGLGVLRVLLDYRVDVNVTDHDGRQPLLWAASAGSSDAVLALTNAGASVQAHDKDGLTALHCAASRGHTDCLETLIELCGADVDATDNNGCSALFYSVTLGHADATHLLLRCGADPNRQDRKGRSAAHCGAAKGQLETLRILKKYNGNLWLRNIKGDYCLHEAINAGRKDLVKWLLSQRPDAVNSSNADGRCSLHIAAITNNIEMCKILLDYQSLVNPIMTTNKGDLMTPLDAALVRSNRGCAKYLQLHGGVPSNKLTSFSAALRGPRRIESHSDYYGSPDGKLETSFQNRSSRSLDTSPNPYYTTNRKVQVRIEANLSTENVGKSFGLDDVIKCTYEKSKRINKTNTSKTNVRSEYVEVAKMVSQPSSDVESNVSDIYAYSSENDFSKRTKRRRRHRKRRQKVGETSYEINSRQFKTAESSKVNNIVNQAEQDENKSTRKQNDSPKKSKLTNLNATPEDAATEFGTIAAFIHRADESTSKRSESSENGFPEIQYEKLETEAMPVTDDDDAAEQQLVNVTSRQITNKECANAAASGEDLIAAPASTVAKTEKENQSNYQNDSEKVSDSEIAGRSDIREGQDSEAYSPECGQVDGAGTSASSFSLLQCDRLETESFKDENERVNDQDEKNEMRDEPVDELRSNENTKNKKENRVSPTQLDNATAIDLPLNQNANFDESFAKDKGLICVILDEDKAIEIERKKDRSRTRDNLERIASGTHRRDRNCQKKPHKFKHSFEVLSDDDQKQPFSKLILHDDSGFEPSPRHTHLVASFEDGSNKMKSRIPRATSRMHAVKPKEDKKENENGHDINIISVTQAVQCSLRKYHLERRVFHTLLELKRLQIRAGKSNEQILVKRLVDDYQKAGLIVGLRQYDGIYSFRHFERYLYEQLRVLQSVGKKDIPRIKSVDDFETLTRALKRTKAGKTLLESVPDNPLFCTHGTHRCIHATHAYTGIPCAAYISKIDHHTLPKTNNEMYRCFLPRIDGKFATRRKQSNGTAKFLKNVDPSIPVTLELIHGREKQIISLPTEKLDKNKRYFVTFTIKGIDNSEGKDSNEVPSFCEG